MSVVYLLDNLDSFSYNLVDEVAQLGFSLKLYRNTVPAAYIFEKMQQEQQPVVLLLSPGPGVPSESGLLLPLIKEYAASKSIFGVCLGQQAIGESFGGQLTNLSKVYHGIATPIELTAPSVLFEGLPAKFSVGRYHSWVVDEKNFPADLIVTSKDENGYIMSLEHKTYDVKAVQYHPESVLTPEGGKIINNWLKI